MSSNETIDRYISTCCKAFILYEGISCKCSACKREIAKVGEKPLIISVKFSDGNTSNVSSDTIENYRRIASRFATDPTYELSSVRCPKCGTNARYSRLPQGQFIYICSNKNCRNVFEE